MSSNGGRLTVNSQNTFWPVLSATTRSSTPSSLIAATSSNGGSAIWTSPVLRPARRVCASGTVLMISLSRWGAPLFSTGLPKFL